MLLSRCLLVGFGLMVALLAPVRAAADRSERVKFDTFDQVELHGSFYPSPRGGRAPAVLMLHALGGDHEDEGWTTLARALQPDYSVLAFDFRGHGDSTEINRSVFWSVAANCRLRGAGARRGSISFDDFPHSYYPMLVNDIAAARLFLDKQGNAGRCNPSNIIVIGAEDGATLGALWIATEFYRQAPSLNPLLPGPSLGKDICCAVWLSFRLTLGGQRMPVENWFSGRSPMVHDKVPMYFLAGAKDETAVADSRRFLRTLTSERGGSKVASLTGLRTLPTSLAGHELLARKSLETEKFIRRYLEAVLDRRGIQAADERQLDKLPYPVPLQRFLLTQQRP